MVLFSLGKTCPGLLHRVRRAERRGQRKRHRAGRPLALEPLEARTLLAGTWTALQAPANAAISTMLLLSDGTVMAHASTHVTPGRDWYRLTPDGAGTYVFGTWSPLPAMQDTRYFFASHVLNDGRVFVAGGELGSSPNSYEIFDPTIIEPLPAWTPSTAVPNDPNVQDAPSEILPDGRMLLGGVVTDRNTYLFDPTAVPERAWSTVSGKTYTSNEGSWMLLDNGNILTVDVNSVISPTDTPLAEKYSPATGTWSLAGIPPLIFTTPTPPLAHEIGAGLRLPDGRAFFLGANANGFTGLYTPSPEGWTGSKNLPRDARNVAYLVAFDAPAAMMPNGKVLAALNHGDFVDTASFWEYDYTLDQFAAAPAPAGVTLPAPVYCRMLVLPNGQVLLSFENAQLYVYSPGGLPLAAGKPTITGVTGPVNGVYTLDGMQLSGISEGAAYGDDAQMASNYPIIQLVRMGPLVPQSIYYARTFDWNRAGVGAGGATRTQFTVPAAVPAGTYSLYVVANGIASDPVSFTLPSGRAPGRPPDDGLGDTRRPSPTPTVPFWVSTHTRLAPALEPGSGFGVNDPEVETGRVRRAADVTPLGSRTGVEPVIASGSVSAKPLGVDFNSGLSTAASPTGLETDLRDDRRLDAFFAAEPFGDPPPKVGERRS